MLLPEQQLRDVIHGDPVGTTWPYWGGSDDDIEKHLRRAVAALKSTRLLDVDADFDHYGSGYASYVHAFCERPGGRSRKRENSTDWIDGIAVYLSRLTPFAVYGFETRSRSVNGSGGSSSFIERDRVYSVPPGDWSSEVAAIRSTLSDLGFVFPAREQLLERLPFVADIRTNFGNTHVFDAIFYWED